MHQRVNLQLGLIKSVRRRVDHVAVDDLTHSRVKADLKHIHQDKNVFRKKQYHTEAKKIRDKREKKEPRRI